MYIKHPALAYTIRKIEMRRTNINKNTICSAKN